MTSAGCPTYRHELGPFIDGELDGMRMLRTSRHVETCAACASALQEMKAVGEALRETVPGDQASDLFDGLAATVISRTRAEQAESWQVTIARGCADWHWAVVGLGSIAATLVSTSLLSFVLAFGPAPQRDNSLSQLATNLGSSPGFLFVSASPSGYYGGDDVVTLQVENGSPVAPRMVVELVASQAHRTASEADLVYLLQQVSTYDGRILSIDELGPEHRLVAEALLDEIRRLRATGRSVGGRSFNVYEMRLVTSTGVSAKRL